MFNLDCDHTGGDRRRCSSGPVRSVNLCQSTNPGGAGGVGGAGGAVSLAVCSCWSPATRWFGFRCGPRVLLNIFKCEDIVIKSQLSFEPFVTQTVQTESLWKPKQRQGVDLILPVLGNLLINFRSKLPNVQSHVTVHSFHENDIL